MIPRIGRGPAMQGLDRSLSVLGAAVVGALLLARPQPAAACRPPPFVAEELEFSLVRVLRAGKLDDLAGVPAHLFARGDSTRGMTIEGLGYMDLREQTASLPSSTERYIRRQRRIGRVVCLTFIRREPARPGRYSPATEPHRAGPREPQWSALWPAGTTGIIVLDPSRRTMHLHIDDADEPLELEYALTRASFSSCRVASDASPAWLAGLVVLLRRRRGSRRGLTSSRRHG